MRDFPKPSETEASDLARIVCEDRIVDALLSSDASDSAEKKVSIRDIYALAAGGTATSSRALEAALAADFTLWATYRRMLRTLAIYHFPALRAASSGTAPHREIAGCKIDLGEDDGQVFVIIELPSNFIKEPRSLAVINETGHSRQVSLPEALRGVIHFPIIDDDELISLLRNPKSEVLLA